MVDYPYITAYKTSSSASLKSTLFSYKTRQQQTFVCFIEFSVNVVNLKAGAINAGLFFLFSRVLVKESDDKFYQ